MNLSHIEHIGIAVKSLDEAIPFWEKQLGLKCYAIEEVKEQKVRTAFFKIGQSKIELLESTDPDGPIGKLLRLCAPKTSIGIGPSGVSNNVVPFSTM